jgi:2,4-dienoyl-CoA reductase-like NADH-dependent reductase (Old Yellow Enzyme family)
VVATVASGLFDPLALRGVTLRNRIGVSPMCMYSCPARDGMAGSWHLVHLGSRAVGGAGLVLTEAAAVDPVGRIAPEDLGIWDDRHVEPLIPVTRFIHEHGAVAGLQLAHAGRKGSTNRNWERPRRALGPGEGGWTPLAPSAEAFSGLFAEPRAATEADLRAVVAAFAAAAGRALAAGFRLVEVHAAHGYLLHTFLSPLTNHREDAYGGSFANRTRLLLEVVAAVRRVWPEHLPLLVRLSVTDWAGAAGWDVEECVELARLLGRAGVDLIDCSAGLIHPAHRGAEAPGYQAPLAGRIRREAGVATAAVGLVLGPRQADAMVREGLADVVLVGRRMLWDPYWPLHAAHALGVQLPYWPPQYEKSLETIGRTAD